MQISIKKTEVEDGVAFYTVFFKLSKGSPWQRGVKARYSQFQELHQKLAETLGSEFTAELPPKHSWIITSHSSPDFVEHRRTKLEAYLNQIVGIEKARTSQIFTDFLVRRDKQSSSAENFSDRGSSLSWAWGLIMPNQQGNGHEESTKGEKLSSVLIKEISHTDDTEVAPGSIITKSWLIKNDGTVRWPEGTRLIEESPGALVTREAEHPPRAEPGEVVEVRMKMQVPTIPGKYRTGSLTLAYPGGSFGSHYWAQVIVRPGADFDSKDMTASRTTQEVKQMMKQFLKNEQVVKTLQAELPFILTSLADDRSVVKIAKELMERRPGLKSHPFVEYILPRLPQLEEFVHKEAYAYMNLHMLCSNGGKGQAQFEDLVSDEEMDEDLNPQDSMMDRSLDNESLADTKHRSSARGSANTVDQSEQRLGESILVEKIEEKDTKLATETTDVVEKAGAVVAAAEKEADSCESKEQPHAEPKAQPQSPALTGSLSNDISQVGNDRKDGGNDRKDGGTETEHPYAEALRKLVQMGFDMEKSSVLLERYDGDAQKALNILVTES